MNKKFRAAALYIAIILIVSSISGCAFKPAKFADVTRPDGSKTTISFNDYLFFAYYVRINYENAALNQTTTTVDYLNQKQSDGKTYNDSFKESAKDNLLDGFIIKDKFKELNLSLSSDELKSIDDKFSAFNDNTILRTELQESQAVFKKNFEQEQMGQSIVNKLFGSGGEKEIKDADVKNYFDENYVRAKHILIKTTKLDEASGYENVLSVEGLAAAEKSANDLYDKAKKGENFENLARYNSQDGTPDSIDNTTPKPETFTYSNNGLLTENNGYTFTKDQMAKEFETAAFEMNIGEVRLVKTTYGYHIVKKYDINEKPEIYEKMIASVKNRLTNMKMQDQITEWAKNYQITVDDKILETYSLNKLKDILKGK